MKYEIEILTPLQIGDGDSYNPMDSITTDNYFYAVNLNMFYEKLHEMGKLQKYLDFAEKNPSLSDYLSSIDLAPEKIKKYSLTLTEQNKGDIRYIKKSRISHFIKNANGEVYIPGSEIKGGIRTSLLYSILKEEENYEYLRRELNEVKSKNLRGRDLGKELENISKKIEVRFLRGKKGDPKYDILKYLEVSDTSSLPPTSLQIGHIASHWSIGKHQYAEILPPKTGFSGNINILKREKALKKLGLEGKINLLSTEYVLKAVHDHSKDIIEHEIDFYSRNPDRHTPHFIDEIKKIKDENRMEEPVLQIGQGQGFISTTIGLLVKGKNPDLYDTIRRGTRGHSYIEEFPKTRRFVMENGDPRYRLGWTKFRVLE